MKYQIELSEKGIDELIDIFKEYEKWLEKCSQKLLDKLAEEGYQVANAYFGSAAYDGTNDATVSVETRDSQTRAVIALGDSVLFIEFGTGIVYPDDHPESSKHGMIRGAYGQGKGKQRTWGYYGDPGTNGKIAKTTARGQLVLTHGNPANKPMYETVKKLRQRLPELVKEVFTQ